MSDAFGPYIFRGLRKVGNVLSFGGRLHLFQSTLRRLFRFAKSEVTVVDFDEGAFMRLRLSEHMQRRIFWMGYYSTDIVALLDKLLRPGMVVVDVGANIGEITMVAARRVGATGKVIAFEPVSSIADRLVEHIDINELEQVIIRKEALGKEKVKAVPIYASCGQGFSDENHGLASLYGAAGELLEYVDVARFDEISDSLLLARIDLIKVDIEGGELACLQGAESVLRRFRPWLIIEVQTFSAQQAGWEVNELFQYLRGFGYEFFTIGSGGCLIPLQSGSLISFQNVFCRAQGGLSE